MTKFFLFGIQSLFYLDYSPSRSKTFVMTTILEEPYMMVVKPKHGEVLTGNDRYEGYCKVG